MKIRITNNFRSLFEKPSFKIIHFFFILIILSGACEKNTCDMEEDMLLEINKLRTGGCTCGQEYMPAVPAVEWNSALEFTAREYARDMKEFIYFSHIGRDGSSAAQRAIRNGYDGNYIGENLAKGYSSVADVLDGWINSDAHCKTIMDKNFQVMGAGAYQDYWVLLFGAKINFPNDSVYLIYNPVLTRY